MIRLLTLSDSRLRRILLHILFWVCVYAYNILENWSSVDNKRALIEIYTTKLPVQIIIAYLLTYVLLPTYLFRKRYLQFYGYLLLTIYVTCILYANYRAFYFEVAYPDYYKAKTQPSVFLYFDVMRFLMYASSFFTPAAMMAVIKLIRTKNEDQQKQQWLERDKLQVELRFLKNQLNPHFLFNTLNNLYMLTLKASPDAPEVVARLSETLDYMLYRCHDREVPLAGEIQLIENYLLLEKLRLSKDVVITFHHQEEIDRGRIAPLIMLSLVENAFKHGVSQGVGNAAIAIELRVDQHALTFSVKNTKYLHRKPNPDGIGLRNIRRQLDLIYQNRHTFRIEENDSSYHVELQVLLNKRVA
jgi:two-component system, LytTR family, sensor kinase